MFVVQGTAGNGRFQAPAIDGKYPDYERVVPQKVSGEVAQYQPTLLLACDDAVRLYTLNRQVAVIHVQHNGNSGALITATDCLCVVMPFRTDKPTDADWFFGKQEQVADAA